ncbi:MAG: hypothetical protein JO306_14820 [Gemmatimonadetes bacterium]|nr:hypothetical protein [Gemmatimonadota bacterium]
MDHLALHVYRWGDGPQRRLLVECLGPAARELAADGLLRRFWFTPFDTRGPHVFALFTPPAGKRDELRARVDERLRAYLAAHPSGLVLSPEELERRHVECRGKQLSTIDTEPGIAPNDSWCWAGHGEGGYPFALGAGLADPDAFWGHVQSQVFESIEHLRGGTGTAAGVRWIAAVDASLAAAGEDPAEYWRYHASTLLMNLQAGLEAAESRVLAGLEDAVSARNRAVFERLWEDGGASPHAGPLVRAAVSARPAEGRSRWALLREVNHFTLAQLGQPVMHQVPLVLYAWHRALAPAAAA